MNSHLSLSILGLQALHADILDIEDHVPGECQPHGSEWTATSAVSSPRSHCFLLHNSTCDWIYSVTNCRAPDSPFFYQQPLSSS